MKQEFTLRLWVTQRAWASMTIESKDLARAVRRAKLVDLSEFEFEPLEIEGGGWEGDEIIHVESDAGEDAEVDRREKGEPLSWAACQFVKDLVESKGGTLEEWRARARGLLKR